MDLCTLGAATIVNSAGQYGMPRANCQRVIDDDADNDMRVEPLGEMPVVCALGVTSLPAPADNTGAAEGLFDADVAGLGAVVVAAWDSRAREVAGQMAGGDSCLYGTHRDATKRAKFFAKENLAAIVVGNDLVLSLDRGQKAVTLAAFGHVIQVTENGVLFAEKSGGNWIELKGGNNAIVGPTSIGGPSAVQLTQSPGLVSAIEATAAAFTSSGATPVTGATLGSALTALAAAIQAGATTKQTTAA